MNFEEECELLLSAYTPEEVRIVNASASASTSSSLSVVHYRVYRDEVSFFIPVGYPTDANITSISISCQDLSKVEAESLRLELLRKCQKPIGEPSLFDTISDYVNTKAAIVELHRKKSSSSSSSSSSNSGISDGSSSGGDVIFNIEQPLDHCKSRTDDASFSRCLIHFHHIMAEGKKSFIKDEAEDLELSGIWCSGFPGCIVVEGLKENIDLYVKGLKGLRWQVCYLDYYV